MKTILKLSLILPILLSFAACEDSENDVVRPEITLAEPGSGESFTAGSAIPFKATFTDDVAIASYNIEIHDNFDGHEHKSTMALQRWSWEKSFDAGGASATIDLPSEINIPDDVAAGPYHFIVNAIDAAGNATTFQDGSAVEAEIYITNSSQALIELEMGDHGHDHGDDGHDHDHEEMPEIEAEPGETIHLHGTITDQQTDQMGIEEVLITLGEEHHDHEHKSTTDEEEVEIVMEFETPIMSIDFEDYESELSTLKVPEDKADGEHLVLRVVAKDVEGNLTVSKVKVHVHDH